MFHERECVGDCEASFLGSTALRDAVADGLKGAEETKHFPRKRLSRDQLDQRLEATYKERKADKALIRRLKTRADKTRGREHDLTRALGVALAGGKQFRLRRLIARYYRKGLGNANTVQVLARALRNAHVKVHPTAVEADLAALVLALGGRRLLSILSHAGLLPAESRARIALHVARDFRVFYYPFNESGAFIAVEDMAHNVARFLQSLPERSLRRVEFYDVLMDELAVQARMRYHAALNKVVGFCRCNIRDVIRTFNTESDLDALVAACHDGTLHPAKEALVVGIASMSSEAYVPVVVSVVGSCGKMKVADVENQAQQRQLLVELFSALKNANVLAENGEPAIMIDALNSDGDGVRRRALLSLMTCTLRDEDPKVYALLESLPLFDFQVGVKALCLDFDHKHLIKRMRTWLISRESIVVVGETVSSSIIRNHLKRRFGDKVRELDTLLNLQDKMNVPAAVKLLRMVAKLRTVSRDSSTTTRCHHAVSFLAHVCFHFLAAFRYDDLDTSTPLSNHLYHMACCLPPLHGLS